MKNKMMIDEAKMLELAEMLPIEVRDKWLESQKEINDLKKEFYAIENPSAAEIENHTKAFIKLQDESARLAGLRPLSRSAAKESSSSRYGSILRISIFSILGLFLLFLFVGIST